MSHRSRKARQLAMNNAHLTGVGVSRYKRPPMGRSIHESIAAERARAIRMAKAKGKAKK
jgi:hypothetical protein